MTNVEMKLLSCLKLKKDVHHWKSSRSYNRETVEKYHRSIVVYLQLTMHWFSNSTRHNSEFVLKKKRKEKRFVFDEKFFILQVRLSSSTTIVKIPCWSISNWSQCHWSLLTFFPHGIVLKREEKVEDIIERRVWLVILFVRRRFNQIEFVIDPVDRLASNVCSCSMSMPSNWISSSLLYSLHSFSSSVSLCTKFWLSKTSIGNDLGNRKK